MRWTQIRQCSICDGWGCVRAVALIVAAILATTAFRRRSPHGAVACALTFALVLTDATLTLYLNTLYCEFSIALFAFATIVALAWLNLMERWSAASVGATALALLGLGFAKMQTVGLPVSMLAVTFALWAIRGGLSKARLPAYLTLLAATLVPIGAASTLPKTGLHGAIRMANATDTWFGAVLPSLAYPDAAVADLGLPRRCAAFVGKTWYDPGMQPPHVQRWNRCPDSGHSRCSRASHERLRAWHDKPSRRVDHGS